MDSSAERQTGTGTAETSAAAPWAGRALDLAQQGYTLLEISDAVGAPQHEVDEQICRSVDGGLSTVRRAVRTRLRAWKREADDRTWIAAEEAFGIPHANITRLVRAPETDLSSGDLAGGAGYLDAVLAGAPDLDERARICARAYAMGSTLQELGDRFDVTRERIRQVLVRSTPWSSTEIAARLRLLRDRRGHEHRTAVREWSAAHPGSPVAEAMAQLGMSEEQVLANLGRRRTAHIAAPARDMTEHRRSDTQILEDLRRFAALSPKITAAAFTEWAREEGIPGHQTVTNRFGGWNAALTAAGIEQRESVVRRRRHTSEDLWAAVISAVSASDGGPTFRKYEEWAARRSEAPSGALVRTRLNLGWNEILSTALEVIAGTSDADPAWITEVLAPRDWDAPPQEEDPVQHVRDALAAAGSDRLTSSAYAQWARREERPACPTLLRKTGLTWPQLVTAAGGVGNAPRRRGISDEEVLAQLQAFIRENPKASSSVYPAWATSHHAPSLATVLARMGTWREALESARSGHDTA